MIGLAYVVDAVPLFLPLDRLLIAFIGVLASPLPVLLAFAALPLASKLALGWGRIGQ